MTARNAIYMIAATLVVLLLLFEVRVNVAFSLPAESEQPDAAQETRYATCYASRDKEIHKRAFGTIDNPDVQKLYILNNRELAVTECRQRFPEQRVTVREPFHFNVVDLRFRF